MMATTPLFFRLDTDGRSTPVGLENVFAGPQRSACWLIGGGPSLDELPCDEIARSPLPKLCVNLAGTQRLRPDFWTAYDPTVRFHRSIYLDPGILKFVPRRRAMDLVPETTFKVCECPGVICFGRDPQRDFAQLLSLQATGLVDWADTFVQAIDLLFRLGFRTLYLAGCELRIRPAPAHLARAAEVGCPAGPHELLGDFVQRCTAHGITRDELERLSVCRQYHFDEAKPLAAAIQTDRHYFRIVQCLRLSRSCLVQHGVELVSVTPGSRLNDFFPYRPVEDVLREVHQHVGNPATEPTRGCYTQTLPRWPTALPLMRDVRPPGGGSVTAASTTNLPARRALRRLTTKARPTGLGEASGITVEGEGWEPAVA